ncbi:MAG: twin-arginine translocase subunit TatC [Proteobacteria bacterium]|nr:twin-arginine translocase subunit TatC [Pseudomonadota bacterium]
MRPRARQFPPRARRRPPRQRRRRGAQQAETVANDPSTPEDPDNHKMPLLDHLIELRQRLIYSVVAFLACFLAAYYFAQPIFDFLVEPLKKVYEGQSGRRMIFTAPTEAFFTYVKVAFFTACFVSFPIIAAQIWAFVAPGLYRNEKKAFLPFLAATPVLFLLGTALLYYVILPFALKFFASFEVMAGHGAMPIQLEAKMSEYLSLVMTLIFAFGISFELPVLLTLLAKVGIVSAEALASKRGALGREAARCRRGRGGRGRACAEARGGAGGGRQPAAAGRRDGLQPVAVDDGQIQPRSIRLPSKNNV